MLQRETVSLSIAGLCMDVDCGAAVAGLPNLLPFVVCGTGRPGGLLCHVLTGRRLGDDADEPLHTAVKDGRRMRMWLKPDRWRVIRLAYACPELSQQEVARLCGVSQQSVSNYLQPVRLEGEPEFRNDCFELIF